MSLRKALIVLQVLFFITVPIFLYSCSASSTVRYNRDEEKTNKENKETKNKTYKETFDITPYRTDIDIKENPEPEQNAADIGAWYGYRQKDTSANSGKTIVGTSNGFRVQVYTTDNLEQADSLKSVLAERINQKNIYVIFDPPFYKVEIGDFTVMGDAKDLNFKLTQMGYTESRVVASTVNVFE